MEKTKYGHLSVNSQETIHEYLLDAIHRIPYSRTNKVVGLTGGSTPKAFYNWVTQGEFLSKNAKESVIWTTSDERMVPLTSEESNFGTATRMMLDPLGIPELNRLPWPVNVDPHSAGMMYEKRWNERFGHRETYALCFLGMGDDGHTASLFPESPLLGINTDENFVSVDVPGKGWRLTITPAGILRCNEIIITVTGENKAETLGDVLRDNGQYPVQVLRDCADRVTWLVDEDAAGKL